MQTLVLTHWFGGESAWRDAWFQISPDFDEELRRRFGHLVPEAARGALDHWGNGAEGAVALCIVLDQFPRNLYRGDPRAHATDGRARALAGSVLVRRLDQEVPPLWRVFLYLPFMHSEDLRDQDRSVALFDSLGAEPRGPGCLKHAELHREEIRRFGRFPARNAALGRAVTTAAERALLA